MKSKKRTHGSLSLERSVATGYKAFLARRGLRAPGKWKAGFKGHGIEVPVSASPKR